MKSILVLCEGNICRSPMAEALLAHALPSVHVTSAGLAALVGMPADPIAIRLMHERGLDITRHRAAQITRDKCLKADLLLTMDTEQRRRVEQKFPQVCGRVYRLGELTKHDIPDPYRQPEGAFRLALSLLDAGVNDWLERIRKVAQATQ